MAELHAELVRWDRDTGIAAHKGRPVTSTHSNSDVQLPPLCVPIRDSRAVHPSTPLIGFSLFYRRRSGRSPRGGACPLPEPEPLSVKFCAPVAHAGPVRPAHPHLNLSVQV